MKRQWILTLIAVSVVLFGRVSAEAQEQLWEARYDGPGSSEVARDISVDGAGNVHVTGKSDVAGQGLNFATVKYDSDGNELWVATYDGGFGDDQARAIAVDPAGNVYVTGEGYGGLITGLNYVTIKYDELGDELWVQQLHGQVDGGDDRAYDIAVDPAGSVYVTGEAYLPPGPHARGFDYVTEKYDTTDGHSLWSLAYHGAGETGAYRDTAYAVAVDGIVDGYVYVTGRSQSRDNATGYDFATIQYGGGSGTEIWSTRYNGEANSDDAAYDVVVDDDWNVYVTGGSDGIGTSTDYATVKYDHFGNEQWYARYDGPANSIDVARAVAVDSAGYVYVTGESYQGAATGYDYVTVKYEPLSGFPQWVAVYAGPGNQQDRATDIALDDQDNVYVTGGSGGDYVTIKYDPATGEELWVVHYDGPANGYDIAKALAVDAAGCVYVTGGSEGAVNEDYATVKYAQPVLAPEPEDPVVEKNRYISFVPQNPGQQTALRVTLTASADFPGDVGMQWWVGSPGPVTEIAGSSGSTPLPAFMAAALQCTWHCTDWSTVGLLDVSDREIHPSATYDVQAIDCTCDPSNEANYSAPLAITTSRWGDVVGEYYTNPADCMVMPSGYVDCWSPPNGAVNFNDISSLVDKFKNLAGASRKARADIAGDPPVGIPDRLVNFVDISYDVDAFRGLPYPFPGPSWCP